jgi:hypothetical protein
MYPGVDDSGFMGCTEAVNPRHRISGAAAARPAVQRRPGPPSSTRIAMIAASFSGPTASLTACAGVRPLGGDSPGGRWETRAAKAIAWARGVRRQINCREGVSRVVGQIVWM